MATPPDLVDRHLASRAHLDALLATAVDGIIVIDENGLIQVYNPACERLFGYRASEVMGQNVKLLMPAADHARHDRYIAAYRETGRARIIGSGREVSGQRKDGTIFPMYLSVGEGHLNGKSIFVGIIHDLTERKRGEQLREYLAAIVDSSHDAVIAKDLDGTVTAWNAGAERLYGYRAEEIVGRSVAALAPEGRKHEPVELIARIGRGEHVSDYDTLRVNKAGRQLDVSLTLSPIRGPGGKIVGASTIARDITQLRRAERRIRELTQEMVHISRLSAMGQLASSIAHELNQPLTAVVNYTETARHLLGAATAPELARTGPLLEKAAAQAERAGQIIRRLRGFVEKGEVEREPESLSAVVAEASELATLGVKADGIRVSLDLAPALAPIRIDKIQIQQVVVNLVRNAVEAMHGRPGGILTIRTAAADDAQQEVIVTDSGPGLPAHIAENLFKPFLTTKKGGMGIGLSISQSIVAAHGGRIWAEPGPGGGTTFRLLLPEG
jgi:two-component system sensor kinase FixL